MKHMISDASADASKRRLASPEAGRAPSPGTMAPTRATLARLRKAAAMPEANINLSNPDAPLVTDWPGAERGRFFTPVNRLKSCDPTGKCSPI